MVASCPHRSALTVQIPTLLGPSESEQRRKTVVILGVMVSPPLGGLPGVSSEGKLWSYSVDPTVLSPPRWTYYKWGYVVIIE